MIGALSGTVLYKKLDSVAVMVQGVGYLVSVHQLFHSRLKAGDAVLVYTHTHVREDKLQLYGFASVSELMLFELLLSVSGIGPKTALAITERGANHVENAIKTADVSFFTSIPRLGTKNAQKIIIELKSKLGSSTVLDLSDPYSGETQEVIAALGSMGVAKSEITAILKNAPETIKTVKDKVTYVLKNLGKK